MFGHLSCKVCGQKFSAPINSELNASPAAAQADAQTFQLQWTSTASEYWGFCAAQLVHARALEHRCDLCLYAAG